LLNYAYVSGSLLGHYNVTLTEGPWSAEAQQNAISKAGRFPRGGPATYADLRPVTSGVYNQSTTLPTTTATVGAGGSQVGVKGVGSGSPATDVNSKADPESELNFQDSGPQFDDVPEIDSKSNSEELNKLLPSPKTSNQPVRNKTSKTAKSYFGRRR
jgi:hypothetical protein